MERASYPLPEGHGWKARPGYRCLVADEGAVRFDFPRDWHVEPGPESIKIYDAPPPEDECCLEMSFRRQPHVDIDAVSLHGLVSAALGADDRLEIEELRRHNFRLLWLEQTMLDSKLGKPAVMRVAVALSSGVQVLLTFSFWEADRGRREPVWRAVLDSLQIGLKYPDPFSGRPIDPSAQ
ncbi:MAG: hypothetical protein HY319_25710 [Armatimonadetes bacterium]|nr:hypothetical protein [Armatimonadota bacterium]